MGIESEDPRRIAAIEGTVREVLKGAENALDGLAKLSNEDLRYAHYLVENGHSLEGVDLRDIEDAIAEQAEQHNAQRAA